MKINCYECDKPVITRSSKYLSPDFRELIFECRHCGERWKSNLYFQSSINPAAGERLEVLNQLVNGMSIENKQILLNL